MLVLVRVREVVEVLEWMWAYYRSGCWLSRNDRTGTGHLICWWCRCCLYRKIDHSDSRPYTGEKQRAPGSSRN